MKEVYVWKPHKSTAEYVTHSPDKCKGQHCCVHNPSDHHMKDWPQNYRTDRGITERICPHGVGHPDPDDPTTDTTHGCDGCCTNENIDPTNDPMIKVDRELSYSVPPDVDTLKTLLLSDQAKDLRDNFLFALDEMPSAFQPIVINNITINIVAAEYTSESSLYVVFSTEVQPNKKQFWKIGGWCDSYAESQLNIYSIQEVRDELKTIRVWSPK